MQCFSAKICIHSKLIEFKQLTIKGLEAPLSIVPAILLLR